MHNKNNILRAVILAAVLVVIGGAAAVAKNAPAQQSTEDSQLSDTLTESEEVSESEQMISDSAENHEQSENDSSEDENEADVSQSEEADQRAIYPDSGDAQDKDATEQEEEQKADLSKLEPTEDAYKLSDGEEDFSVPGQPVLITDIAAYSGFYYEDGSDDALENVLSASFQNSGTQTIEYTTVRMRDSQGNQYSFTFSMLRPGETVQVLEANRQSYAEGVELYYSGMDTIAYLAEETSADTEVEMDIYSGLLGVKSASEKTYSTVEVFYKYIGDTTNYRIGLTYQVVFSNVGNSFVYEDALHYNENKSKIVYIKCIE